MKPILTWGLLLLLFRSGEPARAADLAVEVHGLKSDKGVLRAAVFSSSKGFPMDAAKAIAQQSIPLGATTITPSVLLVFRNLPEIKVAVSVFHDEDSDGKLKTNWLSIPREGVGVSNNRTGFKGPPRYDEAAFELKGNQNISVTLSYRH